MSTPSAPSPSTFAIGESDFLLDGQPHRILSGSLHYFRIHPDAWRDRIIKAREMGLNTIETYVAWDQHSPTPDAWITDGGLDLDRFLRTIAEEGLHAIVRPGPYICAEWDNGGLPAWLFRDASVGVRRNEPQYMAHVTTYLERVYEIVAPLQISNGGPVILVQIENEYGAYSNDHDYLRELIRITKDAGITVPLTSIDQPEDQMLIDGSLPELHKTGSFGSRATDRLATLRRHQPTGPLMCAEFWCGWFDHWGAHHHTTSAAASAKELDDLLATGASVNIYMLHGGTNFGFTNGANDKGVYQPTITSYDYDAPLDEAGRPGEKFLAFREVLAKYSGVATPELPAHPEAPTFTTQLTTATPLLAVLPRLGQWSAHDHLPTLDELAHYRGFAVYRTQLEGDATNPAVFAVDEVRDRAAIFLDGVRVGILLRDHHERAVTLPRGSGELLVIVEDMGRVNYGERLGEDKGLIGPATLNGAPVTAWEVLPIDASAIPAVGQEEGHPVTGPLAGPVIASATFTLEEASDLFLDTSDWGKGIAFVNGFNLGRYWRRGPQQTLYVPGEVTKAGENTLTVFELEALPTPQASFVSDLRLGHTDF